MASLGVLILLLFLDQASKALVIASLPLGESQTWVDGFFYFTHWTNKGAAFGFLSESAFGGHFLSILSLVLSLLLAYLIYKLKPWRFKMPLLLILSGSLGNLIDRFRLGAVTDFIHLQFGSYHYPIFNLADAFIVMGAIFLALLILFHKESREALDRFLEPEQEGE